MAKIKKRPTDLFRSWRWESSFNEESDSIGHLEVKKGFVWVLPEIADLHRFLNNRHQLAMCVRAICMNGQDRWGVSSHFYPDRPCLVSDFEEFYREQRRELLEGVQTSHICDVGWVAHTYSNPKQVDGDKWWQIGSVGATPERQQLWRYYHNVVKHEDNKRRQV